MAGSEISVVYVAGASRSGSTLLGRLLGAIPGHLEMGELRHVFSRGMGLNRLCGCGERFRACGFWSRVISDAFGPISTDRIAEMERAVRTCTRQRRAIRALLGPRQRPEASSDAVHAYRRLLGSIRGVSGADLLIDTSKVPGSLLLLARVPDIRLSVVEIVRDARAVAWSWRRRVERPEIPERSVEMERFPAWRSALEWDLSRVLLAAAKRRLGVPWTTLRYEDLARDPAATLRIALAAIGRPEPDLGFMERGVARLRPGHSVSGNPMRFQSGETRIRPDEEWREALSPRDRALVTAICRPGLAGHGYLRGREAR